jgi:hypothetical protein
MDQVKNDEIELSEEIEITEDEVSVAEEEIVDELVVEKSKPKVKEDEEEDDEDEVVDDEPEESAKGKKVKESKKSLKKEFGHDDEEEDDAEEEEESVKAKKSRKESLEIDMSVDVNALLEGEDFSDDFKFKATTIKEKYFPTETVVNDLETFNTNSTSTADQSDSMSAYTAAITKFK